MGETLGVRCALSNPMRRRRPWIVWLCLIALVWCQVAMAAQACHGPAAGALTDCHGAMTDDDGPGDPADCPVNDVTPDLGKLPVFAPLPGHPALLPAIDLRPARWAHATGQPGARDGPHLATLCQLLI